MVTAAAIQLASPGLSRAIGPPSAHVHCSMPVSSSVAIARNVYARGRKARSRARLSRSRPAPGDGTHARAPATQMVSKEVSDMGDRRLRAGGSHATTPHRQTFDRQRVPLRGRARSGLRSACWGLGEHEAGERVRLLPSGGGYGRARLRRGVVAPGTLPDVLDSLHTEKGGVRECPPPRVLAGREARRSRLRLCRCRLILVGEVEVGEVGLPAVGGELDGGLERLAEQEGVAVKRGEAG
jgi:hypothetical protein